MKYNELMQKAGKRINPKIYYYQGNNKVEILHDDIKLSKPFFNASLVGTIMKGLELELTSELPNIAIYFENTVKYGTDSAIKTIGPYYLKEKAQFNADSKTYTHRLYDNFIKTMVPYNPITITYPCKLFDFFKRLCIECGLTTNITSLPNGNRILDHDIYDGINFTNRDVFDDIGQATGTLFKINVNSIEKCTLGTSNITINDDILKNQNISLGEHFGPINSVVLSRAGESDSIYKRDETLTKWNEIKICDNQLMNDNNRSDYLDELYNALYGIEYDIFDLELIGYGGFEPLQKISIKTGNKTYNSYVFNNEESYTQGYTENIYTELPTETTTDYTKSDKTDRRINQVYIIADKQNKKIEALVSEVDENSESIATLTETSNEIKAEVSNKADKTYVDTKLKQSDTVSGELPLHYENSAGKDLIEFEVDGNSKQYTTTGKNLIRIKPTYSGSTINGITATVIDENTIKFNGTCTADNTLFSIFELLQTSITKNNTLTTFYVSGSASEIDGYSGPQIVVYDKNYKGLSNTRLFNLSNSNPYITMTYTSDTSFDVTYSRVRFDKGMICNDFTIKFMLTANKDTEFELFTNGPSPNPEYPSEIEVVEGIENLFDIKNSVKDSFVNTTIVPNANWCYNTIESFEVGKTYVTSGGRAIISFFNENTHISVKDITNSTFIIPQNTTKMYVSTLITNDEFQLEKSLIAHSYVPYGSWLPVKNIGDNLFDKNNANKINLYPGTTSFVSNASYKSIYIQIKPNETYTVKKFFATNQDMVIATSQDTPVVNGSISQRKSSTTNEPLTITSGNEDRYLTVYYNWTSTSEQEVLDNLMIVKGTTIESFRPYEETISHIPLKGNFIGKINDIKDRLYLQNGHAYLEKNIGKIVFDGSENWLKDGTKNSSYGRFYSPLIENLKHNENSANILPLICNRAKAINMNDTYNLIEGIAYTTNGNFCLYFNETKSMTASEFKTWLSNNNLEIYYILETPEIIDLGEVSISTLKGTNNLFVESNLAPSNCSIKYYLDTEFTEAFTTHQETNAMIKITENSILNEVSDVKTDINSQESRITNMEQTAGGLNIAITNQKTQFDNLKDKVSANETSANNSINDLNGKLVQLESSLENMTFDFSTKGLNIASKDDPNSSILNNTGIKVYSLSKLNAIFTNKGSGVDKLIVTGTAQIGYLKFVKSTKNGKPVTKIFHLKSLIESLGDLE